MLNGTGDFGFTFGASHTQSIWDDVRHGSWDDIAGLLTTHKPGRKEGSCFVPALFADKARRKEEAVQIDVAMLDSDSGATLDQIVGALEARGWMGAVASTHSHMAVRTTVSLANWDRYFAKHPSHVPEDFLRNEKGYLPNVAKGALAVKADDTTITISHQPCPKFRVIVPLARSWFAAEYASQAVANAVWKSCVEALATALGLDIDQSCTDTSRLFYGPRSPPGGPPPETANVAGEMCDIFLLKPPAPDDLKPGPDGPDVGAPEYTDPDTGEVIDLVAWARDFGPTFRIAAALQSRRAGVLTGLVADDRVHIDCPNAGAHTDPARDGATFVCDAGADGFRVHCRHGHCTDRDRLFFVRRMLEEKWLSISDLTSARFQTAEARDPDASIKPISLASLDLDRIPPRRWLYGHELIVGYVSVLSAVGGGGKTAYTMSVGLSVATGKALLAPAGDKIPTCAVHKQGNVWFFNLEDPMEELRRRIKATLQHHSIPVSAVADRIFLNSGRDAELIIATRNVRGELTASPIVEPLVAYLIANRISVLVVDPFVQSHAAEENRNEEMNLVMALWGRVATRADCAIWLVHHFRKGGKGSDVDSVRGAGAIQGAARSMFNISPMTEDEASRLGVDEAERWQYIRHDNAKQNMAPPAVMADWYRLASVPLGNGTTDYPDGDFVQAVESWVPPSPWDGLPWAMIERILVKIDQGPGDGEFYAFNRQAKERWAGRVIADDAAKTDGQAAAILKAWKESGVIEEGQYLSPRRKATVGCVRIDQAKLSEMRQQFRTRTTDDE